MSDRRDFIEVVRLPGWKAYEQRVRTEIDSRKIELQELDTQGKTAEQIGVEHLQLEGEIVGLKKTLEIAEIIKQEPADDM